MATKKKPAAPPIDPPGVLLTDEYNKSIARAKAALAKKWSFSRAETLHDAAQLGWSLVALGRADEALALTLEVCEGAPFTGDANLWAAAASSIVLAARIARLHGEEPLRAALLARLLEHPPLPVTPRDAVVAAVAVATKDIRSAEVESSEKWACQGFARGCARAAYFRETAEGAGYEPGALDVASLEGTIEEGLAGLRVFLAR